jgi:hypothetical protein
MENLREARRLIELLQCDVSFDGFHDVVIEQRFRGQLPRDREKLLAQIDKTIEKWKDNPPELKVFP